MKGVDLTPREEEIAALIILGYDVDEIAAELDLGFWGVRDHVKMIRAKCGAKKMRDIPEALARWAPEE